MFMLCFMVCMLMALSKIVLNFDDVKDIRSSDGLVEKKHTQLNIINELHLFTVFNAGLHSMKPEAHITNGDSGQLHYNNFLRYLQH